MVDDLAKACGTEKIIVCLERILTLCQIYEKTFVFFGKIGDGMLGPG